jgi:hypothetical protein
MSKVRTEYFKTRDDGVVIVVTKSTNNCMIRKVETGELYEEAYDVGYLAVDDKYYPTNFSYVPTDIEIIVPEINVPQ